VTEPASSSRTGATRSRGLQAWAPLVLLVAIGASMGASLSGAFVSDDIPLIVDNEHIRTVSDWRDYFTSGLGANSAANLHDTTAYRPLVLVVFSVGFHLWGLTAWPFHLLNLLLHGLNTWLVYRLVRRWLPGLHESAALAFGLLFAVHPVHVESVAWISGVSDLLATAWFLTALHLFLRYRDRGRVYVMVWCVVCFVLGLLSKETVVVLPLVAALVELGVAAERRRWSPVVALGATAVVYGAVRILIVGAGNLQPSVAGLGLFLQYGLVYAKALVIPWPLPFFLSAARDAFARWEIVAGVLTASTMVMMIVRGSRVARWGGAMFALTLGPALMLAFNSEPVFAGRFLYLPSAGAVVLLAASLPERLFGSGKAIWPAMATVLLVMGALSVSATRMWLDDLSVIQHAIASAPRAPGPHHALGDYYERRGQLQEALVEYQRAADGETPRAEYFNSLGRVWGMLGDIQQSAIYYQESLALDPDGSHANNGMGNVQVLRGDYNSALGHYRKAVETDPGNAEAHYNLASTCTALGLLEEARRHQELFLLTAPPEEFAAEIAEVKRALGR